MNGFLLRRDVIVKKRTNAGKVREIEISRLHANVFAEWCFNSSKVRKTDLHRQTTKKLGTCHPNGQKRSLERGVGG